MAIKNHTYRNHMIVLNRIMKKGYTFSEADALTRNVFSNYGDGNGMSIEALTDRILTKAEWLAQNPTEDPDFTDEQKRIIRFYFDNCSALLHKTESGYQVETPEDNYDYSSASALIDDLLYTIRAWAENGERAQTFLDSLNIPSSADSGEVWAEELTEEEKSLVEELEGVYEGDLSIRPTGDGTWDIDFGSVREEEGITKEEMLGIVVRYLKDFYADWALDMTFDELTYCYKYDESDFGCDMSVIAHFMPDCDVVVVSGIEHNENGWSYYNAEMDADLFTVTNKSRFCEFLLDNTDQGCSVGSYKSLEDLVEDNKDDSLLWELYTWLSPENVYYTTDKSGSRFFTFAKAFEEIRADHEADLADGHANYGYTIYSHGHSRWEEVKR